MGTTLLIRLHHQITALDEIAGQGPRDPVFQLATGLQEEVLVSTDGVRDIGLADGHVSAGAEAAVEVMGDCPTARLGHPRSQPDNFRSDPPGLGRPVSRPWRRRGWAAAKHPCPD